MIVDGDTAHIGDSIFDRLGGNECMSPDLDNTEFGKVDNFELSCKFTEEEKDKVERIETEDYVRVVIGGFLGLEGCLAWI